MHRLKTILICLFLLGSTPLCAQHYIGARGGWGAGGIRFTPVRETGYLWGLYSGGISHKFYMGSNSVGAIALDLQYIGKGYTLKKRQASDTTYFRSIDAIELPFMWQPHFYVARRKVRVFLNLGAHLSYNLMATEWYQSKQDGEYDRGPYNMLLNRDNRLGYGLSGGAGLSVLMNRWDLSFEARYNLGFSDIMKNNTKYELNTFFHSPLDNVNISVALYYRLGRGGLREPISKNLQRKMDEAQAHKIIRARERTIKKNIPSTIDSLSIELEQIVEELPIEEQKLDLDLLQELPLSEKIEEQVLPVLPLEQPPQIEQPSLEKMPLPPLEEEKEEAKESLISSMSALEDLLPSCRYSSREFCSLFFILNCYGDSSPFI